MSVLRHRGMLRGGAAALVIVLLAGCAGLMGSGVNVSQTSGQAAPVVPGGTDPDDEAIGLREHPRIVSSYGGVYSDRQAEVMLARIAGRLLAAADQPNTRFTVTILDTPDVNAFALPGGYIYVTRGLLALASDTSELAAVLAHEIAHVTLRHARARTNRIRTTEIVDRVVTGVFGANAETDQSANRSRLSLAAFSQNQELAADKEGISIAGKAGYDPHAAARFLGAMGRFARFSAGDAADTDDFLSSHPSTPDRVQKAVESARAAFGAPGMGEADRQSYLAGIDGLTFGDSPSQGAIVGRRFIHSQKRYTFTVPDGYALQSSRGAVVGVAGDGEAVRFDTPEVPTSMALTDYLKSGWIAGLKAETVKGERNGGVEIAHGAAQTEQWSFRVGVVRYEGQVYRFIFAAKADNPRFANGALETLRSFRAATARDIGDIRQLAVQMVTAGPADTADTLARRMAGLTRGTELFFILNNLYPGDPVVSGQRYKIVAVK
ncbi:Putative Zn-dependent protease [Devosia enhydra]|uniref:Putative Zn-dependent protease n=1 Tax=Devosia enhydra TaxID=665118 RepID=A0A1K2I0E1_9HYPH|nr:M48 family metalloprotease [Devosia enhydra]SFZ85751.1 Putative Zn-dependent protease [Devosia enhydra]